jgi:hypothetical protein
MGFFVVIETINWNYMSLFLNYDIIKE